MKKEEITLEIKPMEKYETPQFPTHQEIDIKLLKRKPLRWKQKALITGVGLLTVASLSGCSPFGREQFHDDFSDIHHGGAGGEPIYLVYLTEQEALSIVRSKLEEAGLTLDGIPPDGVVSVEIGWSNREIGIDLFDEKHNVGVAIIDDWWRSINSLEAREVKRTISNYFGDEGMHVGVIFSEIHDVWRSTEKEEIQERNKDNIIQQVADFIEQLQEENVIE